MGRSHPNSPVLVVGRFHFWLLRPLGASFLFKSLARGLLEIKLRTERWRYHPPFRLPPYQVADLSADPALTALRLGNIPRGPSAPSPMPGRRRVIGGLRDVIRRPARPRGSNHAAIDHARLSRRQAFASWCPGWRGRGSHPPSHIPSVECE